jgi:hypothetical protein
MRLQVACNQSIDFVDFEDHRAGCPRLALGLDRIAAGLEIGHKHRIPAARRQRERANLRDREPQRLAELRAAWQQWDASLPPIPEEAKVSLVFSRQDLPSATF